MFLVSPMVWRNGLLYILGLILCEGTVTIESSRPGHLKSLYAVERIPRQRNTVLQIDQLIVIVTKD